MEGDSNKGNKNPHIRSSIRKGSICLEGVWKVSKSCLKAVLNMYERCLEIV